ncbi:CCA tRNA nucleotidyltransferase [Campylobacter sputorum]|uniref:CCA tRNA nucleotidyltransferase n=1 Tax=Campylobacter sputorum TaxID=206 RepID=UPI000B77DE58|nr:CCA tRNA nucleotidyltransferase [Campylobacter sputorum]ASM37247.1 multifunctional tRNA nucleotidyl transferase / 2'3'-cyclic phosphodiesterase / 2' nucleotidase/phosphatase [Campylobacter sputorum bv. faecalis CCUG 20703]
MNCENSELKEVINFLKPYTNRAYFVGGSVRDKLLNIKNSDYDIEVYDISKDKFELLMQKIGAVGVGKSYFVYKYKNIDISLPRTETKIGRGHKAFEVSICNDEKLASKRRDFTINSLMLNIFDGKLLDFWGGKNDLENKILKIIDENSFKEDSLRVLRAIQFVSRFNLTIDKNSFEIMKNIDLNDLSKDRIRLEIIKMFKGKFQEKAFKYLYELNLCPIVFGIEITKNEFEKICQNLNDGFQLVNNQMYFLYKFSNITKCNKSKLLKHLNLSFQYKKILNEPFFVNPTKKDLLITSLEMPLSNWLGLDTKELVSIAKNLGIYDNTFKTDISSSDVIKDGFSGENIGKEIKRRKLKIIDEFLTKNN